MRTCLRWMAIAVLLAGVVLSVTWRVRNPGHAFDPVAWRDAALVEQGIRLSMADRLVARDALRGKTRMEVIEMLGEPTVPGGRFGVWDLGVCECRILHD
jgi:hypothetical protein